MAFLQYIIQWFEVLDLVPSTFKHRCGQCKLQVHLNRKAPCATADLKNQCRVDKGLEVKGEDVQDLFELTLCCHADDLGQCILLLYKSFKIGIRLQHFRWSFKLVLSSLMFYSLWVAHKLRNVLEFKFWVRGRRWSLLLVCEHIQHSSRLRHHLVVVL